MNHHQLEKIFGPPIMNQAFKPILAQRPQINIVQVLIALGIGYFFLKGVKYFILENQIIQLNLEEANQ